MARVLIPSSYDHTFIVTSAGGQISIASYTNGGLNVPGVEQQVLESVVDSYNEVQRKLEITKNVAIWLIEETAEKARGRYITIGSGQAMTYQEKGEEATDFIAAGYPDNVSSYPFIQAEVDATGNSPAKVADGIINKKATWIVVGSKIEKIRLGGKQTIAASVDATSVNSNCSVIIETLDSI